MYHLSSLTASLKSALCALLIGLMMVCSGSSVWSAESEGAASPKTQPFLQGTVYQEEYVLGAGDIIYVEDNRMGILASDGKVLTDGSVNLPLVGKVYLTGLSTIQAKNLLNEKYAKYFTEPSIVLQVKSQRPVRVYVTGAVTTPGVYLSGKNTTPENGENANLGVYMSMYQYYRTYLADALMFAGGLKYNANIQDIKIHRTFPKPMTIHVNLWDLFQNGNLIQDIPLRDQDVVEVSEIPDDQLVMDATWEELNRTNLGGGQFKISVIGSVETPGSYMVKNQDTVLTAVAKAGGFSNDADKDVVYVLRTTSTGQVVKRELNLKDKSLIGKKTFEHWSRLMPNDVVYIEESTGKKALAMTKNLYNRTTAPALLVLFNQIIDFQKK